MGLGLGWLLRLGLGLGLGLGTGTGTGAGTGAGAGTRLGLGSGLEQAERAPRTLAAQGVPLLVGVHEGEVVGASQREVCLDT